VLLAGGADVVTAKVLLGLIVDRLASSADEDISPSTVRGGVDGVDTAA
jgi:hypothetical protein